LSGRVQARVYEKKQIDGEPIKHIAYEISVAKFGLNEDKDKI